MSTTKRYSDEELELFKIRIEQKKEKAENDLKFLLDQIENITESIAHEGDRLEDSSGKDLEMLYTMVSRHRHHIQDLENALIRIRNKNYGICVITGQLIDKRRLMAVPTTTKSLEAKNAAALSQEKKERKPPRVPPKPSEKVTTKIIRKSPAPPPKQVEFQDDEDDEDDDFFDDELYGAIDFEDDTIDLENISDQTD